jgi:hypothetical protein
MTNTGYRAGVFDRARVFQDPLFAGADVDVGRRTGVPPHDLVQKS